jgi:hypothetical protein
MSISDIVATMGVLIIQGNKVLEVAIPLTAAQLDQLHSFIGNGTPDAWGSFLGVEEAGGGEADSRARQAEKPSRSDGNALLSELMPLLEPKVGRREYQELVPQFASRNEYHQLVKPRRIACLRTLVRQHRPGVIICHGKALWGKNQRLFAGGAFEPVGAFQAASMEDTLVILTGHFSAAPET